MIEFKNHFVFRQNDYSEQLSSSRISRRSRRAAWHTSAAQFPTTSLSLKACRLRCVIMHHRANVSPVSQPLSTLSASASQSSSTARARPHDKWGETDGCSFSPRSWSCQAAHDYLWGLNSIIPFSKKIIYQVSWSDSVGSGLKYVLYVLLCWRPIHWWFIAERSHKNPIL